MTDNLYIPRQLVQRWIDNTDFFEDLRGKSMVEIDKAKKEDDLITEELRALLAAPVVERQPVAWIVTDMNGDSYFAYDKRTPSDKPLYTSPPAPVAVRITLQQVLKAYDYAESHPHKYLRGTTNWCAAVAHELNACLDKVKELNQ